MMPDREKVIKGIWQCLLPSTEEEYETQCHNCPYYEPGITLEECVTALRTDAIALLKEQEETIRNREQEIRDKNERLKERAEQVDSMLKEQGWIPITERLPKDDTDILVYCTDGEESRIVAVNYANGVWFDCVFNTVMVVENITHWMPLPKPPKEGR